MDEVKILAQEISSYGQSYRSYAVLLENPSFNLNRKKLIEIMNRCGKNCREISRLLRESEVQSDDVTNGTMAVDSEALRRI